MTRSYIKILILVLISTAFVAHADGPFYNFPQTGQTICYDYVGNFIYCAATGQDGELKTGRPWPNPRFTDNRNGTVTDNLTGLIWLKKTTCLGYQTWDAALTSAKGLATAACDLTDGSTAGQWRLPSIVELESLVDPSRTGLALPAGHPFLALDSAYWSGSTYADKKDLAWYVHMGYGLTAPESKTLTNYVWPVRSGQ